MIKAEHTWFPPMYANPKLNNIERLKFDYGLIVLSDLKPHDRHCGFGFSATHTDRQLLSGLSVSIFGYPMLLHDSMLSSNKIAQIRKNYDKDKKGDRLGEKKPEEVYNAEFLETNSKDERVLFGSGGEIQSVTGRKMRYFVHTSAGQSGSPVYIWDKGVYTVVGIQ